ncbi:hypothetical protein D9619_011030 [Psilocybe cf. subviscida]|uniref:Nephrocystin 3-like N-terminal domain-containing protein n=1 Tax=Psilocybe cf. subviscida TaxID=2480587 RepID=A0A8H5B843_9AGAR|nr:hypothetical protein D9619_011030 [Psilocybe cf. subviscida]
MPNHMFTGASKFVVSGGTFINHSEKSALDKLSAAAAHAALHDAPARTDASRCHQHTRTNVLDHLERWAQGICDEGVSVFWLYGGAGAGKSAIMQTLAERCVAQHLALGSFFFSGSDPTRNTAEVLIPTLVYQLAQLLLGAVQVLELILDHDPLIFKKSFRAQLLALFVRPLQHLVQLGIISDTPQSPRVFLVDGLDECSDPAQQQAIIQAVAAVCHEHHIPVKFLIASRPELVLSASFEWYKVENHLLGTISLSEDADAEGDIRRFIEAEFLKIRTLHPFKKMIRSKWPDIYDINRLIWKSSSHFIYASTAMKYIWSTKENPVRSLQVVLGLEVSRTTSPFAELDALYHHILGSAAHRDKILQALAHCLHTRFPSSIDVVCAMHEWSRDDFFIYMADMTMLVTVSVQRSGSEWEEVKILHASLRDFLRNQSRSGALYVNKAAYLASKLERCSQLFNLYTQFQSSPPGLGYMLCVRLRDQIVITIAQTGHLVITQEVLKQYGFGYFYQSLLRLDGVSHHNEIYFDIQRDVFQFLRAVQSIKTPIGVGIFRSFLQDFFDILESHISGMSTLLAPAILPLIYLGYSCEVVCEILDHDFAYNPIKMSTQWASLKAFKESIRVLDIITTADLSSICHNVNASPARIAAAADAILGYLMDQVRLPCIPAYSSHKAWLRRMKPGKHVATGSPRLASAIHAQWLRSLRGRKDTISVEQVFRLRSLSMALWPQRHITTDRVERWKNQLRITINLLDALLWVLPQASISEQIVLYSKRTFPWYQLEPGLVRRVRKSLDRYSNRVQIAKLEELGRRIEDGNTNALIEKLCTLYLNDQD